MKAIRLPASVAQVCREAPRPLVLVPTMGALHEGHLALIRQARSLADQGGGGQSRGSVVVSLFVNPTQFGPKEDFSQYPRTLEEDTEKCRSAGVDFLFTPEAAGMYAADHSVWVDEEQLSGVLCGASRPGHFRGVCTVVTKLFNLIAPDIALFGEKDAQQLAIIRRLVRDLDFQVKIVGAPTVREPDGLALSSRNRYLSAEERAQAPVLREALLQAAEAHKRTPLAPEALKALVVERIGRAPLAKIDYVEVVDAESLGPPSSASARWLVALAVFFGKTRLIDNITLPAGG